MAAESVLVSRRYLNVKGQPAARDRALEYRENIAG
jgi:hypothetical protein